MSNGGRAYFTYTPRKYQTSYKWAEQHSRGGREREKESEFQCGSRKWKREELHVPLPDLSTYKVSSKMFFQVAYPAYLGANCVAHRPRKRERETQGERERGRHSQTDAGNVVSLE